MNQVEAQDLKSLLKEALVETLSEQKDLLRDVFAEVFEDVALTEAIRQGRDSDRVSRDEILSILEG